MQASGTPNFRESPRSQELASGFLYIRSDMSIKLMTAVWENDQTNGSERLVLMALADMANDAGVCWPSYLTLARKANISRRSAIRYMHSLINKGLVRKEYRTDYSDPNDLKQTSNLYTIVVTPGAHSDTYVTQIII